MRRHSLWALLGLCLVACFVARELAAKPSDEARAADMQSAFQGAEKLFYARRFQEAGSAYHDFIKEFSSQALTAKAWFRLGEIAFHDQEWKDAISHYRKSTDRELNGEWGATSLYKQAVAWSKLEDEKKVFSVLDRIPLGHGDSKVALRAASLRVNTARKAEDSKEEIKGYLEAVVAYEGVGSQENESEANWIVSQKTARGELRLWIDNVEVGDKDLKKLTERFDGTLAEPYVLWKSSRVSHDKGKYDQAGQSLRRLLEAYPKSEFAFAARALLKEVDKRGGVEAASMASDKPEGGVVSTEGRPVLGIVLPLSGKYAVYGESALHGLECAAGIYSPCSGDLGVNLRIRDSQGDPRLAARYVEELSRSPDVKAILGPMATVEVDQAAAAAEAAAIPMIALSQKPDLPKAGDYVFRNFLTISDQVSSVIGYACREKRWKKLAIFYPAGSAGEEYRKSFEEEVDRCGGKVVASASYGSGKGFGSAVASLEGTKVQGLFVPDVYRTIPNLVAALKEHQIEGVHLLGGAGWNHPDLVATSGADLEGSYFVDAFFTKSGNFSTKDFVSSFNAAYGVDPTLLEAYAYDTLRLVGDVLRGGSGMTREDIQASLALKKNFSGVTGTISFDRDGDARRRLTVLTVDQGEIREVR